MDISTLLIVRGLLGVLIGIVAVLWPGMTLTALVLLFGVYAFLDGLVNLVHGLARQPGGDRLWPQAALGAVGIAAGVLAFLMPGLTLLVLVMFVAAWAIVRGALEIAVAVRLRRYITGEWLAALAGALSILFGLMVFFFPGAGAVGLAWLLGIYAAAVGIVLIALGVRVRRMVRA